ncbi:MAG: hypothetical protein H0U57_05580 [Tatlockia sp.]|nr:hypothetical protein [Tatlockia sp.]
MNKLLTVICFFCSMFAQAASAESKWSCIAIDGQNRQWTVSSNYHKTSFNKSVDECKKRSNVPATCHVIKESCNMLVKQILVKPRWQCTAFDFHADKWIATSSRSPDKAALSAKGFCKLNSALPDSCYINVITCRTLNTSE